MGGILNKAGELLSRCDVMALASINEAGYPRICVLSKIKARESRRFGWLRGTSSVNTAHFEKNSKASI